ncbi:MAG: DivIVA domain-containing protein [Ilumatobacteraceae bacterium]
MELSPAQISGASFRTTRKGYDPDEVDAFLVAAAKALEDARQQATAMEARARAAVARLQEVTAAAESAPPVDTSPPEPTPSVQIPAAEAETISRTLVLAQRTADTTVAEARQEADRIVHQATVEGETTIDSTREMSAQILEDARAEARRASETERQTAENEVQALVARREFLIGDVDQLERFLIDQRDRLRGAARQIEALCERVPAGLGSLRPPVLSASDDDQPGDPTQEISRPTHQRSHDASDDDHDDDDNHDDHDHDDHDHDDHDVDHHNDDHHDGADHDDDDHDGADRSAESDGTGEVAESNQAEPDALPIRPATAPNPFDA